MEGTKTMSETLGGVLYTVGFFSVFYPILIAYIAGGIGKVVEALTEKYTEDTYLSKYGEADDY